MKGFTTAGAPLDVSPYLTMVYNKKTPPRCISAGLIVGGERVKASEVF